MTLPNDQDAAGSDRLILDPKERRPAVVDLIRSAEHRVCLTIFRCTDFKVLDALADALRRKVRVQLLVTRHAKNWKKRLGDLRRFLEGMGAEVHRYEGIVRKYHAKYLLADDTTALVTSMNLTRKCLQMTCDFQFITRRPEIVSGLRSVFDADWNTHETTEHEPLDGHLIVGPENSRARLAELIASANDSIRIIDHKLSDPAILSLLETKQQAGVRVAVLGAADLGGLVPHGKMVQVDGTRAAIGSISLSARSLDTRREVAVVVDDPACARKLSDFFDRLFAARESGIESLVSPKDLHA